VKLPEKLNNFFRVPPLTRTRMILALGLAMSADALQIGMLPVAWTFAQSAVDVAAMVLTMWIIGFHLLLLPTFIIEFIPVADMLPTWTGCVVAVIALRKREQRNSPTRNSPPPTAPDKPAIDI
jgi:hypothetical protein